MPHFIHPFIWSWATWLPWLLYMFCDIYWKLGIWKNIRLSLLCASSTYDKDIDFSATCEMLIFSVTVYMACVYFPPVSSYMEVNVLMSLIALLVHLLKAWNILWYSSVPSLCLNAHAHWDSPSIAFSELHFDVLTMPPAPSVLQQMTQNSAS